MKSNFGAHMYQKISNLNGRLAELCGYGLILMVIFLVVEVASRLAEQPIYGGTILAVSVMIITIYFGLASCEQRLKHISMDVMLPLLPSKLRKYICIFNYLLLIVLYAAICFAVTESAIESYRVGEAEPVGSITIPVWPVKTGMAVGLLCYWLQLIANLYRFVSNVDFTNALPLENLISNE